MNSHNAAQVTPIEQALPIRLLLVDDEPAVLRSLKRLFRSNTYQVHTAGDGQQALKVMEQTPVDIIISDMRMPNLNGAQFLQQAAKRWPDTIRMLLTGYADLADAISAINKGQIYRYFSKPWDEEDIRFTLDRAAEQLRLKRENERLQKLVVLQNRKLKSLNTDLEQRVKERTLQLKNVAVKLESAYHELKDHYDHTVELLTRFTDMRDTATAGHGRRVAELAKTIAEGMKLNNVQVQDIRKAGLLHDIGKMVLPDDVVNTPYESLSPEAKQILSKHAKLGEATLMGVTPLKEAAKIIRAHHEHVDGKGYPDGLKGNQIPLGARILAIAEAIDEYCIGTQTGKPYTLAQALEAISKESGKQYDAQIIKTCKALHNTLNAIQKEHTPNMLCVSSSNAKPGMKLVRDLMSSDGMLLLTAGHTLTNAIIEKIRQMELDDDTSYLLYVKTSQSVSNKYVE